MTANWWFGFTVYLVGVALGMQLERRHGWRWARLDSDPGAVEESRLEGPDMSKVKTCPQCGAHSAPDKSERAS